MTERPLAPVPSRIASNSTSDSFSGPNRSSRSGGRSAAGSLFRDAVTRGALPSAGASREDRVAELREHLNSAMEGKADHVVVVAGDRCDQRGGPALYAVRPRLVHRFTGLHVPLDL